MTVHATLTCLLDVLYILKDLYGEEEGDNWNTMHLMSIAILIFAGLMGCCVAGLMGYHAKLACEGITTNEELRGKFGRFGSKNPYDNGCKKNCSDFWYGGTSRIYQ